MKTKIKMIAFLEIAVVLCSVFLVALPATVIAADQTVEKVSANTITTASEDDYVLGVYGNANEDDTIDMRDLTYVKLIFFGKKPETELADAKYDGKINPLDFIQIKLIIVGKEKELTVVDSVDRIVTLDMPIERVVVTEDKIGEVIRILGVEDKVVGIDPNMAEMGDFFPVMRYKTPVGNCVRGYLDYEKLAELHPDLVIIHGHYVGSTRIIEPVEKMGIPVVCIDNFFGTCTEEGEPLDGRDIDLTADNQVHCFRMLGTIFNRDEKALEFLDWRTKKLEMIMARTEDLQENEILDAYLGSSFDPLSATGNGNKCDIALDIASIHNLVDFYPQHGSYTVDPEWILVNDPDIAVFYSFRDVSTGEYTVTDPSKLEEIINTVCERPEFKPTTAVKNGKVYVIAGICLDVRPWVGAAYLAKMAYPERFKDIDPEEIHREYIERWIRVPYQGIYFWPKP